VPQHELSVYLNDHLAGASAALELLDELRRMPELEASAEGLHTGISEDRRTLQALMAQTGIAQSAVRQTTAWIAERLAETKAAFDDRANGSLRRLEFLEALSLGMEGKRALWTALRAAAQVRGPDLDYAPLIERAERQGDDVEEQRLRTAAQALRVE
jgi:hypothetical protein